MLTRIVISAALLGSAFLSPSPALAVCQPKSGASCPAALSYTCSYTSSSGGSASACCTPDGGTSCTQYKLTLSGAAGANTTPVGAPGNGSLKVNPAAGCSGGINTALGCIPYDTKGFTSSLLGFLIGLVGLIAIVVMLVATFMIMTGGSNPEQVKKGKELFTAGITGLLFIVFSVTILRIIAGDIIKLPGFT